MTADLGRLGKALEESLLTAQIPPTGLAVLELARYYASLIDRTSESDKAADVAEKLGPKYMAALTSLGLAQDGKGVKTGVSARNPALDELRARRSRRTG